MERIATYEDIITTTSITQFIQLLKGYNCKRCSLCEHDNTVVVSRGNPAKGIMLVGEAPGAVEDQDGVPFSGPAGQLMDQAFAAAGINTNLELYLTNCVRCRPIASEFSGKQNYTPKVDQRRQCLPFLLHEIKLINPRIVIACGAIAAETLFKLKQPRMTAIGGTIVNPDVPQLQNKICYIMHHPAYVLHQKKAGGEAFIKAKRTLWNEILKLKEIMGVVNVKTETT